jgi:predicted GNAT family N-acyltransferase
MKVQLIESEEELKQAFLIRQRVFVEEQKVAPEEEYDEFETSARHFLAYTSDGQACGTARWRYTDKGIKLERFAVLPEFRSKGVGQALVQAVVDDISTQPEAQGKMRYLHAQLTAVGLYERFGFKKKGDQFDECGILHYMMHQ